MRFLRRDEDRARRGRRWRILARVLAAVVAVAAAAHFVFLAVSRSRARALAEHVERVSAEVDASSRWQAPAHCLGRERREWAVPPRLHSHEHRALARRLRAELIAGERPHPSALALAERAGVEALPWHTMVCGRDSFVPFGERLDLVLMLHFAQRAVAGGERCLEAGREVIQAGFAEAARPVGYPNDLDEYRIGTAPVEWAEPWLLRCAARESSEVVASLARALIQVSPPSPSRHIALDRVARARSYSDRLTRESEGFWLLRYPREPDLLVQITTSHLVVAELAMRLRDEAMPDALRMLEHPDLADGFGAWARGMVEDYVTALARVRMVALALSAIAGEPLEVLLDERRFADPFTGRAFEWDGARIASPGIRTASGGVAPIEVRVPR